MKKWIFIIALVGGGIWLILSSIITCDRPRSEGLGDSPEAIYRVQTPSRVYYTNDVSTSADGIYILRGFHSYENGKWRYYKTDLVLTKNYGKVIVNLSEGGAK